MKARGNKLFAGSRMMLPEHREMILRQTKEASWTPKPSLDEQRYEEMEVTLREVLASESRAVHLQIWHKEGTHEITGRLLWVNPLQGTLAVQVRGRGAMSFRLAHVLDVRPEREEHWE